MPKTVFQTGEHRLIIPGPAGELEALLTVPEYANPKAVGLICHPHPLHAGTMHNKVVSTVARSLRDAGIINLRFNFRGVGNSEGKFADAISETDDALACVKWLAQHWPHAQLWLTGFSFGSYVAYRGCQAAKASRLVCIAPAVHHYDFNAIDLPTCPWWVLQPEADEVVPPDQVFKWVDQLDAKPTVIRFPDTSHFFHGQLIALRQALATIWV